MGVSTKKRVELFIGRSSVRELLSKDMEQRLALKFHQENSFSGGVDSWVFAQEYVVEKHTYSFVYDEVIPLLDMLASFFYEKKLYGVREKEAYQFLRDNTTLNELMINELIRIFFYDAKRYGR